MPPTASRLVRASTVAVLAAVATLGARPPRDAEACSEGCGARGFFVPGDGSTVPANLPAIYWRPRGDSANPSPSLVTLTTAADPATPLAFTATRAPNDFDYLLVPSAPLVAGTQYILTDTNSCSFGGGGGGDSGPSATFTVGPTAPLPTTLGSLGVTDLPARSSSVATSGGSCSASAVLISAAVAVDFTAQAVDAAPWKDVLHFQTYVDNQPWSPRASILADIAPGASWEGRGFDRVFSVCRVDDPFGANTVSYNLAEGTHAVQIRATLPGTSVTLSSSVRDVTLACPSVLPPDGDGGVDPTPEQPGGCCSSSTNPAGAAGLALLVVALVLTRPARRRRGR